MPSPSPQMLPQFILKVFVQWSWEKDTSFSRWHCSEPWRPTGEPHGSPDRGSPGSQSFSLWSIQQSWGRMTGYFNPSSPLQIPALKATRGRGLSVDGGRVMLFGAVGMERMYFACKKTWIWWGGCYGLNLTQPPAPQNLTVFGDGVSKRKIK